jgi:glycosyltransferase involved in cell wall biosynthesis
MKIDGRKINHPSSGNQSPAVKGEDSGPQISVIIPALNEAPGLEAFLRKLLQQPGSFEVIVTDGGSIDGTRGVVEHFPGAKFVRSGRGRGRQMNEGARRARGEILLFLHADTTLPANALLKVEKALADSSAAAGSFSL